MKLSEISNIPESEYVTCQRIVDFCKNIGAAYIKPDPIKHRSQIYISNLGWQGDWNVYDLYDMPVIITGYSDYPIGSQELDILECSRLRTWFANNTDIDHPKLVSVPLGLPNEVDFPIYGNSRTLHEVSQTPKNITNLAYMNFKVSTCLSERLDVLNIFSTKDWVISGKPDLSEEGYRRYLQEIRNHKFCISPRGNGVDCHRIWECLYLGTIPIVKRSVTLEQFSDLPILFVDDWAEVTQEFLQEKYEEFSNKTYNFEKLHMSYWKKRILDSYMSS